MTTTEKILLSWGKNPLTNRKSCAIIKVQKRKGNENYENSECNY